MGRPLQIYTIGFTRKTAREFFTLLERSGAKRVVDVRLNNVSQLAGFAKRDDLQFFLERFGLGYVHLPILAPTQEMLDAYKKETGSWADYENKFLALMAERHIETAVKREALHEGCLLCSEETPEKCHRRLVVEYLQRYWNGIQVVHLV